MWKSIYIFCAWLLLLLTFAPPEASAQLVVEIPRFYSRGDEDSDTVEIRGESRIESHYPFYMNDQGL